MTVKVGNDEFPLRRYNAFPSRGNQAEDYNLVVNGVKLGADKARTTTGRDKHYTYFMHSDVIYYVPGHLPAGSKVTVTIPPPKEPKAAPAAPAAPAPAKAAPAKAAASKAAPAKGKK